ncbi:MAG TPA: hypothetical protein VI685_18865 [Candidatus Angelobacter sp.]
MAIHTKYGEKVINESIHTDQDCLFDGDIVKVWATLEGQATEKQYWISDLVGDRKKEVFDVIKSNLKKRESAT